MRKELVMRSRSILYAVCVLGALAAAACGSDDSGVINASGGSSGKGNGGSSGKGGTAAGGTAAGGTAAGGTAAGGTGGAAGAAGDTGCTQFSAFVHGVIKDDTNAKSAPRSVNDLVFCDDPMDPAAYKDLF